MSWSIGYDFQWKRDIGYGVSAICDHPGCKKKIDRGLAYVCGGEPYGGEKGCGLYFCDKHHAIDQLCKRCQGGQKPFKPKEDCVEWVRFKLTDPSWERWRMESESEVLKLKNRL